MRVGDPRQQLQKSEATSKLTSLHIQLWKNIEAGFVG